MRDGRLIFPYSRRTEGAISPRAGKHRADGGVRLSREDRYFAVYFDAVVTFFPLSIFFPPSSRFFIIDDTARLKCKIGRLEKETAPLFWVDGFNPRHQNVVRMMCRALSRVLPCELEVRLSRRFGEPKAYTFWCFEANNGDRSDKGKNSFTRVRISANICSHVKEKKCNVAKKIM